jgi:hypothetical protein
MEAESIIIVPVYLDVADLRCGEQCYVTMFYFAHPGYALEEKLSSFALNTSPT